MKVSCPVSLPLRSRAACLLLSGVLLCCGLRRSSAADATLLGRDTPFRDMGAGTAFLTDLTPDKARYHPRSPVLLTVTVSNPTRRALSDAVVGLACSHLETTLLGPPPQKVHLAPGASRVLTFRWMPPTPDYRGYRVEAVLRDSACRPLERASTAVDVSSSWLKFPRYGYLTRFEAQSRAASKRRVQQLNALHLNALQFYDWQYKHHQPLAGTLQNPAATWPALSSTAQTPLLTSRRTLLDLLDMGHRFNMAGLNYNLLYGAWRNFEADGVNARWGLFKKADGSEPDSLPLPSSWQTDALYLFNPANTAWREYLLRREAEVFAAYPFDGWHVDQVGSRGQVYDANGQSIALEQTFAPFLNAARARLRKKVVFNNVGAFGLDECLRDSREDAAYIECWEWDGQRTYLDLQKVIERVQLNSKEKAPIIAAYMNKAHGQAHSGERPGTFNLPGLLLTDATIFASGGSHIELGDGDQMLSNEYFPNRNLQLTSDAHRALRRYYDFLVAYQNLLRDGLRPNPNTLVLDRASSRDGAPQTVWTFARSDARQHVLHFINLVGQTSNTWRDDQADRPASTTQTDIVVTYYVGAAKVKGVFGASPDEDGATHALPFVTGTNAKGRYVRFTLPRLAYWDMVLLRTA